MLLSKRKKLEDEYYKWINDKSQHDGFSVKDCPFNVITFLDKSGWLKDEGASLKEFMKEQIKGNKRSWIK